MSRLLLDWNRSRALRIAKMLAWTIVQHERANEAHLWQRMPELYPAIYARVTGGPAISWPVVLRYTLRKQGVELTPSKLAQRADKTGRYAEFNEDKDAVVAAYEAITAEANNVSTDCLLTYNPHCHRFMALPLGFRLGPYEIVAAIGAGGMGEVYRATDTRLDRPVAIKVLPETLASDPLFRKRFEREARVIATLNHPHICTLHDVGADYLVMEYVEGTPLRGPLPIPEALRLAAQIADALDAAHRQGITHRDLKPSNVLVTKSGVKLLDFGLAKHHLAHVGPNTNDALTISSDLTRQGSILGTPPYMAPEQLEGKEADPRSDIFAFGCVLYELITGRRAFEGSSVVSTVASILQMEPPPVSAVQPASSRALDRVVQRCLAKDPEERWQTARDLRAELEWVAEEQTAATKNVSSLGVSRRILMAGSGAALLLLASGVVFGWWIGQRETTPESSVRRFVFTPDTIVSFSAVSPNGRHIAYSAAPDATLWIQDLDRDEPRRVVAAGYNRSPIWSPDSGFVAFRSSENHLRKVSVHGGPLVTLCEMPDMTDGQLTWSPDGKSVVFGAGSPSRLYEVPAGGGTPKLLLEVSPSESAQAFRNPHFLPDEGKRHKLVFDLGSAGNTQIVVQDMEIGRRELLGPGSRPFYSPSGHILYETAGELWAMPFSASTLERLGEPFPIRQDAASASVARDGTLVYLAVGGGLQQLRWRDRKGIKLGSIGQPQARVEFPRLSPDGTRVVALGTEHPRAEDVWIHDVARSSKTRLTSHSVEDRPVWTPHGNQVTFTSRRNGNPDIFIQQIDSGRSSEILVATAGGDYPDDWSADGMFFMYTVCNTTCDLWYLVHKRGQNGYDARPFIESPADEQSASFSPDGHYVAYASSESGKLEVYIQRFPEGGGKRQISTNGGVGPRWRRDGKELFYTEGDWLIAVSLITGPSFSVGRATRLFHEKNTFSIRGLRYDVTPDGQRFVIAETLEEPTPAIHVVQNWFAEFRDQQPRRRAE